MSSGPRRGRPPLAGPGRFVAAVAVAVVVVGGGVAFERVLGPRRPAAAGPTEVATGAWFCPHSGGRGWRVWVVAANPSDREAAVRVTTFGAGRPSTVRQRIPGGSVEYVPVTAEDKASASVVEFFGPRVSAGMVAARPDDGGLGAEPCASRAGTRWFVPEGTSVRGQASHLVVANPFAEEAVVDVTVLSPDGPTRPGPLSGVVIEPQRAVSYDLNEVVLGKDALTVLVRASLGKVAVGGVDVGEEGLRSVLAVPGPARTWVLPGAGHQPASEAVVTAPAGRRVPFRVRTQGPETQITVLEDGVVPPEAARTFEVEGEQGGLVVEAEGEAPLVAGRRLTSGAEPPPSPPRGGGRGQQRRQEPPPPQVSDTAATSGTPSGARGWVALPAAPPGGARTLLILENAGAEDLEADVVLLTRAGPHEAPELSAVPVPAGLTVTVDLAEVVGQEPVAAVVGSPSSSLVVAQATVGPDGYAVSMATPMGLS